jgi:hypothetical protein
MVLTDVIGLALRAQRQALPDSDQYRLESAKRLQQMSEIQEAQIELDGQSANLANPDSELDRIMGLLGSLPGDKRWESAHLHESSAHPKAGSS